MKPLLAITMGDINGVGPEILAKVLDHSSVRSLCRPFIVGSRDVYEQARKIVGQGPQSKTISTPSEADDDPDSIAVMDSGDSTPHYEPGKLSADAGRRAMRWLNTAVAMAINGEVHGIVTCPINKEGIHQAGYTCQGHTDFIAELTGSHDYRMCLFAGPMRVVHISAHHALREALTMVTKQRIADSIRIGHEALARLDLPRRRIAVAGLNPHAGENGAFGREEIEEIVPAIRECQSEQIDCSGPFSPDIVFRRMRDGDCEMVIAMYHDQGHIPMKLIAMNEGVNVTLGIPIVRTSPDHGTAYDIAGQGVAREDSLNAAIRLAAMLASPKEASTP